MGCLYEATVQSPRNLPRVIRIAPQSTAANSESKQYANPNGGRPTTQMGFQAEKEYRSAEYRAAAAGKSAVRRQQCRQLDAPGRNRAIPASWAASCEQQFARPP